MLLLLLRFHARTNLGSLVPLSIVASPRKSLYRGRYLSMNTGIVAAGPEMHAKIVEAVKQLKAEGVQ